ncbi:hypothetical protein ABVT39_020709, partial [Epinephelus coioides]
MQRCFMSCISCGMDRNSFGHRDERLDVIAKVTEIQSLEQSLHEMSIAEENLEESDFNDLMNSVIDWADEGSPSFQQDDSSDDEYLPPISLSQLHVQCEDNIIGSRAAIIFEDCLRQLATFLILPMNKCEALQETGVACGCVPPFDINIKSKGTAMIVEWIQKKEDTRHMGSITTWTFAMVPRRKIATEMGIPLEMVTVYGNRKLWFNKEVKSLWVRKNQVFKSRDTDLYKTARYEFERAAKTAKARYRESLEDKLKAGDVRGTWQGLYRISVSKTNKKQLVQD